MDITLRKAEVNDAARIHEIQVAAFLPLLERYQDLETNPACEDEGMVVSRILQPETDYHMVMKKEELVGSIRVRKLGEAEYRVGPVCIRPAAQNQGIVQEAFRLMEGLYPEAGSWELDTILEEERNCHLYEKMGYVRTGQTGIINERMTLVRYRKERRTAGVEKESGGRLDDGESRQLYRVEQDRMKRRSDER